MLRSSHPLSLTCGHSGAMYYLSFKGDYREDSFVREGVFIMDEINIRTPKKIIADPNRLSTGRNLGLL